MRATYLSPLSARVAHACNHVWNHVCDHMYMQPVCGHVCQADASEAPVATYPFTAPAGRQPTFMLPSYRQAALYLHLHLHLHQSHVARAHCMLAHVCVCVCVCKRTIYTYTYAYAYAHTYAYARVRVQAHGCVCLHSYILHLQTPTALRSIPPSDRPSSAGTPPGRPLGYAAAWAKGTPFLSSPLLRKVR